MSTQTILRNGHRPLLPSVLTVKQRWGKKVLPFNMIAFILLATGDILFSFNTGQLFDVMDILFILVLQGLIFLTPGISLKYPWLALLPFYVSCSVFTLMDLQNGYLNGGFFYVFPAAAACYITEREKPGRSLFRHILAIVFIFSMVQVFHYMYMYDKNLVVVRPVMLYRLVASLFFTSMLMKNVFKPVELPIIESLVPVPYYSNLFQSYMDACILFNPQFGEIIECNKQVIRLFEIPEGAGFEGLYITQVMIRYLAEDSPNKDMMMNGVPDEWNGEATFYTYGRKKFHAMVNSMIFSNEGTSYQVLSIRDITNIKKAEKELVITRQNVENAARAKARFLSSMSHELRTPLNGIIGTSNLILTEPKLPENIKNHINILRFSSEHMLGIINDILDFSKIDAGKMELNKQAFNIKESLDILAASFYSQYKNKGIELKTNFHPNLRKVIIQSDEVKLSQVISNLLSNALKFTFDGHVQMNALIKEVNGSHVTLCFEVKDTGIGIDKDKLLEIFQGFVQVHADDLKRRFGGTGLGLTISERLVKMFGGDLQVESELGKGTRFFFTATFELASELASNPQIILLPEPEKDIRGVRILVVEDNEINAKILKGFLRKWEIRIKEADHGLQALELLKYHTFDLVLMDLEMPEMDGYTTIKKIRENGIETPVIAFTAALLENMESLLLNAGFNDFVLKPFRPAELKKKIEKYAPKRVIDYI